MYYKKYEQNKCQQGKYEQGKHCNNYDVAYYEVKKHDNGDKCKCDIEKTEGLIEAIEDKAEKVLNNLVNDITPALADAADALAPDNQTNPDLAKLAEKLRDIADQLDTVNDNIVTAREGVANAQQGVSDARETQGRLIDLIEDLERQFGKTVWCLKKDEGGHPILIPIEKDYGCGYNKPKKCDCDWED